MSKKKRDPSPAAAAAAPVAVAARRTFLGAAAFVCGLAVMVLELAGNRVLAPWFGNSLYTWTGLIGVVLVSLSGGYYLGGLLADRRPRLELLVHLVAAAAAWVLCAPIVAAGLERVVDPLDVIGGPVVATALLLSPPAVLLAMISPFATRLVSLLDGDRSVGRSAGWVGMLGTVGSVAGTFLAGFYLIPQIGLKAVFLVVGGVLAALALAGYGLLATGRTKTTLAAAAGGFCLLAAAGAATRTPPLPGEIHRRDSFYHRIRVTDTAESGTTVRRLYLDSTLEGSIDLATGGPELAYQRYWELSRLLTPQARRAAFLGGGALAMPMAMVRAFPQAEIDVAEIDPAVVETALRFFVRPDPRLHVHAADARRFLERSPARYDFIFGDAYHGVRSVPAHLTTREFFQLVKLRLSDGGVYVMNVAAAREGPPAGTYRAIVATLGKVFAHVEALSTDKANPREMQGVILVAADRPLPLAAAAAGRSDAALASLLDGYIGPVAFEGPVLSDDWNPIEAIVAAGLRR